MIDLHCHLLPGLDDGAKDNDTALSMARLAQDDGIQYLCATPHIHPGYYDNSIDVIKRTANLLLPQLKANGIDIQIRVAAEVHLCPEIMLWAEKEQLPFVGRYQGKQVLLLEFPHSHIPLGANKLVKWLLTNNILPMIAHPERNRDVWRDPRKLQPFLAMGCLLQITAGALLGHFREQSRLCALTLIKEGKAHVMASDGHDTQKRPPVMAKSHALVTETYGQVIADALCRHTPADILQLDH